MPGCSTAPIGWPHGLPKPATANIHIGETDTTCAIGWKGRYHIRGPALVYSDHETGAITTILGYPTETLALVA